MIFILKKTFKSYFFLIVFLMFIGTYNMCNATDFKSIPYAWKWLNQKEVIFYCNDGKENFVFDVHNKKTYNVANASSSELRSKSGDGSATFFAENEDMLGALNITYSPDKSKIAYTKQNDLYVRDLKSNLSRRLTFDGSDKILNGYASWVYYEEIFGRASKYKAFWWSPDSKKIAFYCFDNSQVPCFPIYSPFGASQVDVGGKLINTNYPKAGQANPKVKIGVIGIQDVFNADKEEIGLRKTVWLDFDEKEEQYFGTPFWGEDSKQIFISRQGRTQNYLELFAVSAFNGTKTIIYKEKSSTWLDWIDGMLFGSKGLYMVRSFEGDWQQIYYLSYDGKQLKRLTNGENWRVNLLALNEQKGELFFTAHRGEATVKATLYKLDIKAKAKVKNLTDLSFNVSQVSFSPDKEHFVASLSNFNTPTQLWVFNKEGKNAFKLADMKGEDYKEDKYSLPQLIHTTTEDGFKLPGYIIYPYNFDKNKKYPLRVYIYGGPDTPVVRDRWINPTSYSYDWFAKNGVIQLALDCRAAGHNGRKALDMIYKKLGHYELKDFIHWAKYLQTLPFVKKDKIGVQGFSFGGTMTALLVMSASDYYRYGIAGGGVYDWVLYDTHYTERFMDTPQNNPEGYKLSRVLEYVKQYPTSFDKAEKHNDVDKVMLKIHHGTADDNVHFQNTLQLIDCLQKEGKKFELMLYPDALHGYHSYQRKYSEMSDIDFWKRYFEL